MIPTDHEVYNQTRALLGEVPSGTRPSNATLHPYLNLGYQRLFTKLKSLGSPLVEGEGYGYILPHQSRLPLTVSQLSSISAYGAYVPNLGFIKEVWERKGLENTPEPQTITNLIGFNAIRIVTHAPHGLVDGDRVELMGASGFYPEINGSWTIDVEGPDQFQIRGCYTTGTMTSSGHLFHSKAEWQGPLESRDRIRDIPTTPQSTLGCYCFQGGYLYVPPQAGEVLTKNTTQVKIIYSFSGSLSAPGATAQTVGIDDSLNYLSHATVASFLNAKGVKGTAQAQFGLAEEALVDLLRPQVRQLQLGEPIVQPPFRGPRRYGRDVL